MKNVRIKDVETTPNKYSVSFENRKSEIFLSDMIYENSILLALNKAMKILEQPNAGISKKTDLWRIVSVENTDK